mmetsp:Transcript_78581/g.204122  ORF Transcript_78581/g.204122 Transcript_78581/m.204122 type:complete len:294 (+) Transcript_78581:159-1040(+)
MEARPRTPSPPGDRVKMSMQCRTPSPLGMGKVVQGPDGLNTWRGLHRQHKGDFSPPPAPRSARPPQLMRALQYGSAEDVEKVLKADPRAANSQFDDVFGPPLCWAARTKCLTVEITRLLLAYGADPNEVDAQGHTVLTRLCETPDAFLDWDCHWAALWHEHKAKLHRPKPPLLAQRLETSAPKAGKKLQIRASAGLIDVVICLLAAGADPYKPGHFGRTPVALAVAARCTSLANLLRHACLAPANVAFAVPAALVAPRHPQVPRLSTLPESIFFRVLDFCVDVSSDSVASRLD